MKGKEMLLKDKVAVITGGGQGIGRSIAMAFAREGADVVIAARNKNDLDTVVSDVKALGRKGAGISIDLSQRQAIKPFVEEVFSLFPMVHILVNNVGIGWSSNPQFVVDMDEEYWDASLFLNLTLPLLLTKAFLPGMIAQKWGRIINISSTAGKLGVPRGSAYSATKHGLIGLTRSAAIEVATSGVTVNAICPGPVRTRLLARGIERDAGRLGKPLKEIEATRYPPIKRLLEPEEVAAVAVYLASEDAGGMTGQSLNITGGKVMH